MSIGTFWDAAGSRAAAPRKSSISPPISGGEVEAVGVHHLGPRRHEVAHELVLRIRGPIDLRKRAKLRVRAEDQVHARAGPLEITRLAIVSLEHAVLRGS